MAADPMDSPRIVELARGFYVRNAVDNMAWIDLGGLAVVVDALEEPHLEDEVFADIERTLGPVPVGFVLNTHTHHDHIALNPAFVRRWSAKIINHEVTPLPAQGRWFEGPSRRVQMLPLTGTHTPHDCVVWSPADRVLLVGDIFGYGLIPLIRPLDGESAQLVRATYRRLIDLDPAVVVPGHGPICGKDELVRWLEYFDWLIEQVRRSVAEGLDEAAITQRLAPPADMHGWWRFVQWKHADSLRRVITAFGRGHMK